MRPDVAAVVLAAGEGKRMKSDLVKTAHTVAGVAIVEHVVRAARNAGAGRIIVVVGKDAEQVRKACGEGVEFVLQTERLGTGHACQQAEPLLQDFVGTILVLCGDAPLITERTLKAIIAEHELKSSVATVLTAYPSETRGLGRIVRKADGSFSHIVEEKDATPEQKAITEINAGFYCFSSRHLFAQLHKITNNNVQGEYMLTDVFSLLLKHGLVSTVTTEDYAETIGINDRVWLSKAEDTMQARLRERLMWEGVTFINPNSTYLEPGVKVGRDTTILPGCVLRGTTQIGEGCEIGPHTTISNSVIGRGTVVMHSVVTASRVGSDCHIGPFAHLRPDNHVADSVRIGNFVEVKKAEIGTGSKVSHLSYVGDALIGENVNMGAGTIIVNYDGTHKHQTVIKDRAFVGCNSNLVAPVTIGEDSFIAAGSTITKEVPPLCLAVGRARQENKEGWVARRRLTKTKD